MKGIYIFLADGFEISEAMTPVDMLRRGGVNVKTVSIYDDRIVTSSNRIPVVADMAFGEFKASTTFGPCLPTDVMIFPGGMPGSSNLAAFSKLMDIMVQHYTEGGTIAAICAAPSLVLSKLPDISGKSQTIPLQNPAGVYAARPPADPSRAHVFHSTPGAVRNPVP